MGFCLFEDADMPGSYFAVNVAHVDDVAPQETGGCLIKLGVKTEGFAPLAVGTPEGINKTLMQAAKIGLGKVETELLTGKNMRPMPYLLNQPDRVALVRELTAEELFTQESERSTASQVYFADGTTRIIAGRPSTFISRANAGGKIPGAPQ